MMTTSASPSGGDGGVAGSLGSASYGVIDNRSEILQHLRRALGFALAELRRARH